MNEFLNIILGVFILCQAIIAFTGKGKYNKKLLSLNTAESVKKYNLVIGISYIVCAIVFIVTGLATLGFFSLGIDLNNKNVSLAVYGILLVALIAATLIGNKVILKPLEGVSKEKSKANDEEEDY